MPPTDEENLSIERAESADEVTVRVTGEVDPSTAGLLEAELTAAGDGSHPRVVVESSGISFIDSSGLRALLTAERELSAKDIALVVRSPSDALRRLLEITDLLGHFKVDS